MATTVVNVKIDALDSYFEGVDGYTTRIYYTNPQPVEFYFEIIDDRTGARYGYKFEANVTAEAEIEGYRSHKADESCLKWRGAKFVGV